MSDRRRRTRIPFRARVDIQATGMRLMDMESRDLSHKGVYVLGDLPLKQGQSCMVTVHLVGQGDDVPTLQMEGRIVRSGANGTAIDFVSMDPDTFMHLRNIVLLNAQDPDTAEIEFTQPAFDSDFEA